jgi:hypothetical protein
LAEGKLKLKRTVQMEEERAQQREGTENDVT